MRSSCILLLTFFTYFSAHSQTKEKRDKFPSYFGIVAAPVIPSNFLGQKTVVFTDPDQAMTTTFQQKIGYTFGASVRIGLTKRFSIETGLMQVRRNFLVDFAIPDSNIYARKTFSFVSYDLPINGLVYIQLSDKTFMNAALGVSITQYPSDIQDSIKPGDPNMLVQEGRRLKQTHFAINAGLGFEYRTEKSGTFYIGGSGKVPLLPIMYGVGILKQAGTAEKLIAFGPVEGNYFSIDLRYYFPNVRNKGMQFKPGPIE